MKNSVRPKAYLLAAAWLLLSGTTYIIRENGETIKTVEQDDGIDRVTVFEDGHVVESDIPEKKEQIPVAESEEEPRREKPPFPNDENRTQGDIRQIKLKHADGSIKISKQYKNDKLHGPAAAKAPDGTLTAFGYFFEGALYGPVLAADPMQRKACAAFYWKGKYVFPLYNPSCTDPAGLLSRFLNDEVEYRKNVSSNE